MMYRKTPKIPIRTPPGQNLPCSEKRDEGANAAQEERSPTAQQRAMKISFNTHDYIPLDKGTEKGADGGGTREDGDENTPPAKREEVRVRPPLQAGNSDQPFEEPINLFQSISVSSTLVRVESKNSPAS